MNIFRNDLKAKAEIRLAVPMRKYMMSLNESSLNLLSILSKKLLVFICLLMFVKPIFSRELIHNYYGDYKEVVRIVFVLRTQVHYTTMMDTDNKLLTISLSETRQNPSLFKLDFGSSPLLSGIEYEAIGSDLKISISTNIVYYAECFSLVEDVYKVVVDIYRQKEPTTIEQAREYINFYRKVGYHDRANALQRRINNNDFYNPITTQFPTPTPQRPTPTPQPPTPTPQPPTPTPQPPTPTPQFQNDPFGYVRPNLSGLSIDIQNWIIEAFRLYDIFKELRIIIENAERTLMQYDSSPTIDISFLETMSISHNSLSDAQIKIHEIRLHFINLINSKGSSSNQAIDYTERMINHILSILDSYRIRATDLQAEYARRINR